MLKLLGDRVGIELVEEIQKLGSIILPDGKQEQKGIIVSIGTDVDVDFYDIKIGDKVMFEISGVHKVEIEGKELLILPQESIIGVEE